MSDRLKKVAALQVMLLGMERDLGIEDLSSVQKKILYATTLLEDQKSDVALQDLTSHPVLKGVSRTTFFRAMRALVEAGHIKSFYINNGSHYRTSD